jgi:hypothetical protein
MKETIQTIIDWCTETFPDATLEGQLKKFDEESMEFSNTSSGTPDELEELADMFIVACSVMRFDMVEGMDCLDVVFMRLGVTMFGGTDLWKTVEHKMEKNRKRVWEKSGDGKYHHV